MLNCCCVGCAVHAQPVNKSFPTQMLLKLLFASLAYCQFAPLESQNGVMLGAWLDTQPGGETPSAFNTRMGFNSSFFQMAQDFPLDFNKPPPVQLITQTGTNAMLYLTVYPRTFASIVDNDINELVKQIGGFTNSGFQVFLRFAPGTAKLN